MKTYKYLIITFLSLPLIILGIYKLIVILSSLYREEPYVFLNKWSIEGEPVHIAIDTGENVYVGSYEDKEYNIQKFASNGKLMTKFWDKETETGKLKRPGGIAISPLGYIYVVDSSFSSILKFNSSGKFMTVWKVKSKISKEFWDVSGIATDADGNIYISSSCPEFKRYIQKFDSNGKFITKFELEDRNSDQVVIDIAINSSGDIYCIDALLTIGGREKLIGYMDSYIYKFDKSGKDRKKYHSISRIFEFIPAIALDRNSNILTPMADQMVIYDLNGKFIAKWGSSGKGDGEFNNPADVAVDSDGNVYVVDVGNHRIQKFAPNPDFKPNK